MKVLRLFLLVAWCLAACRPASAQQRHADGVDDYAQYAPYAALLAMKACGLESRRDWPELAAGAAASWVVSAGAAYALKNTVREWRPDRTDRRSFPSGHATFAFAGATALSKEFGHLSPWVTVGGYTVAALTAADRVAKDRHHWYDVCAGGALGVASAELCYYVADRLSARRRLRLSFTGASLDVAYRW